MGKNGDPEGDTTGGTLSRPRDPKMQAAKVHMLNGTSKDFELHRGSDGDVLFTKVTTDLSIEEREYFSLCFYDENRIRHWLYNDKKILKQLKGLPWEFSFEVKFYPTSPTTLNDDNARYNLFLQLRKDIASGRLPATIPTHATLGAYVAQAEYGDADSSAEYERYLKDSQEVPNLKDQTQLLQLLEKVKEVHREQKGLTPAEAESRYLETCKQLSMYGVFVFDAKDDDNNRVGVGICSTGINIYKETIRVHRFAWQNIVKISYKKNTFSVKLKAGELDKKEVTLSYKVQDYLYAKRVWKCGVEHHTFFRLIQPEDKPKSGIFHWGSTRFRYHGRTQFQTKMASQMFDHSQGGTIRNSGNRLSQSYDNGLNKENVIGYEKSSTLGRDGQQTSPVASPGVSYDISTSKRAGSSHGKVGTSVGADDELVYTPVESPTSAAYYLSERSSLRSPYSSGAVSPNDWSAWGRDVVFRHSNARRNLFGRMSNNSGNTLHIVAFDEENTKLNSTERTPEIEHIPIQQNVSLYHRGYYTEPPVEPTVRIQHYAPRNGYHPIERLQPRRELDIHPLRFFVNLNHSGQPERPRIKRACHIGDEDTADPLEANYNFDQQHHTDLTTLPLAEDISPANILQHSAVYYYGKGSVADTITERPQHRLVARVLPYATQSTSREPPNGRSKDKENAKTRTAKRKYQQDRSVSPKRRPSPVTVHQDTQSTITAPQRSSAVVHEQRIFQDTQKLSVEHEVERRQVRYIARVRHEGEEDVVEKDQVQPELYGLPSTSYEGPLEDIGRQDDLDQQPLQDHVNVYHSGQSWTRTVSSPVKEAPVEHEHPKKKAVLHVKSSPKQSHVIDERPEVRLVAKILPSDAKRDETTPETGKTRQTSSNLLGFLKSSGNKSKSVGSETSTGVYPSTFDRYEGPLDSTDRRDDLTNLPLEHHPRVPFVTKYHEKTTVIAKEMPAEHEVERRQVRYIARVRHEGEEDVVEKDQVQPELYGLPSTSYEGPLEDIGRQDDLDQQPLQDHVNVYHSGQSWTRTVSSPVKEAPVEHEHPKKKAVLHVKSSPKQSHVIDERPEVRLVAKILPSDAKRDETTPETGKTRQTSSNLLGFLKSSGNKSKSVGSETSTGVYPSTFDRYEGPLDSTDRRDDLTNLPLEHHPRVPFVTKYHEKTTVIAKEMPAEHEVERRQVRYIARVRHEGEEDVVEKDQVQPELYGLPSTSYEGPLEDIGRQDDLDQQPLQDHVNVYHSGQSWTRTVSSPVKEAPVEHEHPKKKAVLHVKSSPKQSHVIDERPEVRLVAKILPSDAKRDETTPETGKTRQTSSNLLGFLKSSGNKSKSVGSETSTGVYPSTFDRYEGPLDSTDRRDDLTNLPLEHHPRVPFVTKYHEKTTVIAKEMPAEHEVERRQVRYIARVRHEGEEDVVEKDQVQPELYGLPSTSYEGPLEDIGRQDDLDQQPLQDHVNVYHSGQSWTRTVSSPVKEAPVEHEHPKKKAVLHVKSSPKQSHVIDERPEVRLVAKILPSDAKRDETTPETGKTRQTSSNLLGFLKSSGNKSKSVGSETSTGVYPSTFDRYEGPLDSTDRRDDLTNLPLEHHPRVPFVTKYHEKTTVIAKEMPAEHEVERRQVRYIARVRHEGEEDVVEKDQVQPELYGLPSTSYEGPLEDIGRQDDLDQQPLQDHVNVYHSGQSWTRTVSSPVKEAPVEHEHPKKKAVLHVKSSPKQSHVIDERPEVRLVAKILPSDAKRDETTPETGKTRQTSSNLLGFLKSSGNKSKSVGSETSTGVYPSTFDRYEGPLDSTDRRDDLTNLPLEHHPRVPFVTKYHEKTTVIAKEMPAEHEVERRQVRYIARVRHEGEEDVVEKDQVQPELYGLPSTSYEGPLEDIGRQDDLDQQPLQDHVNVYHSGQSWTRTVSSPVKEAPVEHEHPKKKAVLHVKSSPKQSHVIDERPEVRLVAKILPSDAKRDETTPETGKTRQTSSNLLGFLKSSGNKSKSVGSETSTGVYPSTFDRYEGPLDSTDRRDDLTNLPLEHHPRVPFVTKYHEKTTVIAKEMPAEHEVERRQVRYIARVRHEGEEDVVEKDQVQPELYGLPSTSYEGPLEDIGRQDDLDQQPLQDHVNVYHSGQSWTRTVSSPVKEAPVEHEHPKKKAVLHVKSSPKQSHVIDERPEVRLVAKILPSDAKRDETTPETGKTRQTSSNLLGFLKSSGNKSKSVGSETSTGVYPSTFDRYEGPLDSTDRRDDLTNLPLEHHPRVPFVTKYHEKTTVIAKEMPAEHEVERRQVRYIARVRHEGEEDVVEKDQVQPELYGLPSTSYEGPLEDIGRQDDLDQQPLQDHVNVYHSGQSWTRTVSSPVKEAPVEHEHPKKKAVLHVKSSPKQSHVIDERPEVRLVAKILPSDAKRDETTPETGKTRQTSSNLLGFLKSSGNKSKSVGSETSTGVYPSTFDRYEGPLDSTDRRDDLTNLPLEHHPRVPFVTKYHEKTTVIAKEMPAEHEVERRQVRYIARVRHEGEEDVVEKDQVQPELYGLPSTSYEGPLEDIGRQDDLDQQPLQDHVNVYHSGQSWTRTVSSPVKEAPVEHEHPKKKAVLHVKSSPKQSHVIDERPEVRLVAKILPSDAKRDETTPETGKTRQTSSNLLGFLKSSGNKSKSVGSETSTGVYPSTFDRYEGPLDSTDRRDDLTNLPLEHHPRVPFVTKYHEKTTVIAKEMPAEHEVERRQVRYIARVRHEGEEDVVEKDQVQPELYGLPSTSYEGPLEDIGRQDDLDQQPLQDHVNVYHSGQSWTRTVSSPVKEAPVEHEHPKKKAVLHVKSSPKQSHVIDERPEVRLVAKILPSDAKRDETTPETGKTRQTSSNLLGFLKSSGNKSKSVGSETSTGVYPSTFDRYEGPLDSTDRRDDLTNLPLEHHPRVPFVTKYHEKTTVIAKEMPAEHEVERRQVRYIARVRHEGEEDVVEKDQVQPELYGLPSTSYEGPLEDIGRQDDLDQQPLQDHVNVYHSGQSWTRTVSSPVKEAPVEHEHPKKKAVLHVKSSPKQSHVIDERPEVRLVAKILPSDAKRDETTPETGKTRQTSSNLLGFLKSSGNKSKSVGSETSTGVYPSTFDRYEGPLDSTDRRDDLTNLPLEHHPRVPFVTKYHEKTTVIAKEMPAEHEVERRQVRYIARVRHEGEEDVVEKDQVQPELYGLPSTSYEGPLEDIGRQDDLDQQPLQDHVNVYHSGQSWTRTVSSPVKEAPVEHEHPKKKAVLHVKSSPKQSHVIDERPEVRLVAKILPSDAKRDETTPETGKTRQTSSNLLGFLKSSGNKSKSVGSETSTGVYPSTFDRYEGPLDSTDRRDDLTNLPLEHHPRVPFVTKYHEKTTVIAKEMPAEHEVERRQVRYIARVRHEGEEDVVEKDQVQPELYGLPSTSYEGPLEDIGRQDDLDQQPLQDHVNVYHSGQSWTRTVSSPVKEAPVEHEHPKKKAVLHVKSSPKQSHVIDERPEVRLVAKILPSDAKRDETTPETGKTRQTSSNLLGFLKSSGNKSKSVGSETSTGVYPSTFDRYEGPLDSTDRRDDLTNLPLEHHPRVPFVTKYHEKTTVIAKEMPAEHEVERRQVRYIARVRHEGEEDVVEKDQVQPELYGLPSTSYEGPLEDIGRQDDLDQQPLQDHVNVYHSGQSWTRTVSSPVKEAPVEHEHPKKKAVLHVKSSPKQSHVIDERPEVRLVAKILPSDAKRDETTPETGKTRQTSSNLLGFLKSSGNKSKSVGSETSTGVYPSTFDRYEGPLDSTDRRDDLTNLPLEHHPRVPFVTKYHEKTTVIAKEMPAEHEVERRQVRYIARVRHEGEEDVVEKDQVQPELYGLPSTCSRNKPSGSDGPPDFSSAVSYHSEGVTPRGDLWVEVRLDRRVEVQLEPMFCLSGAGLGAVSEDEGGLVYAATSSTMAPVGRSFLSRLGFKSKKSKKSKGEHEVNSSDSSSSDDERVKVVPLAESLPSTDCEKKVAPHKLVRHEVKEQSYRLSGQGLSSGFDPEHPSLSSTIAEAERLNQHSPRLEHAERTITVRALAPLPVSFEESGQPHTTVASWQESTVLPDQVTVQYDDQGNRITRTIKTSQVKHTVQKQSFQNYTVPEETDPTSTVERTREQLTPIGALSHTGPVVDTQTRSVIYESNTPVNGEAENLGEFVSSKTVTSGNRTIETITYKTERDGIIETHVEHRVTIHSDAPIDHDAELSAAIAEATQMNPDMTVEKIEVRQETST